MENEEDSPGPVPFTDHEIQKSDPQSFVLEQAVDTIVDNNAHVERKQVDSPADGDENESAEVTQDWAIDAEDDEQQPLSFELQEGWKILDYFLRKADSNLTEHFMNAVDSRFPETQNYYDKIKDPIWLTLMKEKFQKREYKTITEFVTDIRRMIYNCCSFNGISHPISKKAMKIEYILSQKLNLLRHDIRVKTCEDLTTPWLHKDENQEGTYGYGQRKRYTSYRRDDSSAMRRQLRLEEEQKAKEARRQKKEDSRAAQLAAYQELLDWEENNLTVEPIKSVIKHSWELPQVGLFLFLCREALNLEQVPMYELERCLAMSRQSLRLQQVMTMLLNTPFQRKRMERSQRVVLMPYKVWTEKLAKRLDVWYKTLDDCHGNTNEAAGKLGLVERSFEVIGLTNPLREKFFHRLSFYKKIWIIKSLCEYLVETEEELRNAIETTQPQEDQRGQTLGTDRHGNVYVHFPQFCGPDLRIYRQRKPPVPEVEEEEEVPEQKPAKVSAARKRLNLEGRRGKRSRCSTPLNDSETESRGSPAPSNTRTKSQAGSSRHSSPLPRERTARSRQTSARNSPAPDSSVQDGPPSASSAGKGRKTRNSAESVFYDVDLEALLRRNSRRGKAAKGARKEAPVTESSSNVGDECSQDGMASDSRASGKAAGREASVEKGVLNGRVGGEEGGTPVRTSSGGESREKSQSGTCGANSGDNRVSHSHLRSGRGGQSTDALEVRPSKTDPDSKACDNSLAVKDGAGSNNLIKACDIKNEGCAGEPVPDRGTVSGDRHINSSRTCDTRSPSATKENPSSPRKSPSTTLKTECPDAVEKDGCVDDSGFASSHTSPHCHEGRNSPDRKSPANGDSKSSCTSQSNATVTTQESAAGQSVCAKAEDGDAGSVTETTAHGSGKADDGFGPFVKERCCREDDNSLMAMNHSCKEGAGASPTPQGAFNALMDHDAYSEEEMMPEPGEFELVVDSMEALEELIRRFDPDAVESSPQQASPAARAGKRQAKSKSLPKPAKRWNCENELHKRLSNLKRELDKFKEKLAKITRRARAKLRREFQEYVEEVPQVEETKEWDTESEKTTEESNAGDSSSGEESEDSQDTQAPLAINKKKTPSNAPSTASVESSEADQRGIEDYDKDVSSRGRLRKRRLIPNNSEDQGVKKKKVPKKAEEAVATTTASHVPSSLAASLAGPAAWSKAGDEIAVGEEVKESGRQLDALAKQPLGAGPTLFKGPRLIQNSPGLQRATASAAPNSGVARSGAHPVMQKMLRQLPLAGAPALHGMKASSALHTSSLNSSGPLPSTAVSITVVPTGPTATVSRATAVRTAGTRSLLLNAIGPDGERQQIRLNTQQQQELLRQGILIYQPALQTGAAPQTQATASSGGPPLSSRTLSVAGVGQVTPHRGQPQVLVTPPPTPRPTTPSQAALPAVAQGIVGVSPTGQPVSPAKVQAVVGMKPAGQVISPAKVQSIVGMTPAGQVISPAKVQAVVAVSASGGALPPVNLLSAAGSGAKMPLIVNNSSGKGTLYVAGNLKAQPRYASNMTVKKLLANKAEDSDTNGGATSSCQASALGTMPQGPLVVTTSAFASVRSSSTSVIPGSVMQRLGSPATVLRLPGQSSLDDALQTVVTSYHTTLPTADIKVPSPTTLPSLSPRKNVTRTVQSTKAPIPTTTRMQTEKKSVSLTKTIVSGGTTFTLGPNAVAAMIAGGSGGARPGPVVLPAGQQVTGVDASGKKQVMLQVMPHGVVGGGNILQGYILPQGATVRTMRLGNPRTLPTSSSAPDAAVASPVGASGATMPGSTTGSGSLMPQAVTSKTTSEVLKSMLAARGLTNSATPTSLPASVAATMPGSITSSVSVVPRTLSALNQLGGAEVTHTSHLISTPMAGVTMPQASHPVVAALAAANQGGVFLQTVLPQMQGLGSLAAAAVASGSSAAATVSQSVPPQNVVHVSLPVGLPVAALQSATSGIRLVAGQLASSSADGGQVATAGLKPGVQGLPQQLQALVSPGSLQRMRTQLLPPQQAGFVVDASGGQVSGGQSSSALGGEAAAGQQLQQTLQLHFKVQPNQQAAGSSASVSGGPPPVVQGGNVKAAAAGSQGLIPMLASPALSPNNSAAAKVILASPTTITTTTTAAAASVATTIQLSAAGSGLVAPSCSKTRDLQAALGAAGRLSLSVIPGPLSNQFTISPVPTQSASSPGAGSLKQASGGPLEAARVIVPAGGDGGQVRPNVSSILSAATSLQLQLGVKRGVASSGVQPIPAKMARMDPAGGNSGAVLASLSQMVGSGMNRHPGQAAGDAVIGSPAARGPPGGGLQRVVKASAAGDVGAGSTLQSLAAHVAPAVSPSVLPAASGSRENSASVGPAVQGTPARGNMAQILQQLAVVSPVSGAGTAPVSLQLRPQQGVQQQQQVITMRQVGGQLLTPSNVPVTVHNNGEVKVLPKATLQMGSQTVTVVSPSSAMIHNLKTPVNPSAAPSSAAASSSPTQSAVRAELKPLVGGAGLAPGLQALLVSKPGAGSWVSGLQRLQGIPASNPGAQGMTMTFLKPESKPGAAPPQLQPEAAKAATAAAFQSPCQDAAAGADSLKASSQREEAASPGKRQLHSTPVLKARLERPVVSSSAPGALAVPALTEAVNSVVNGQKSVAGHSASSSLKGDAGILNGQADSEASMAVKEKSLGSGDGQNEVDEEEAALNLLQLANQHQMI